MKQAVNGSCLCLGSTYFTSNYGKITNQVPAAENTGSKSTKAFEQCEPSLIE